MYLFRNLSIKARLVFTFLISLFFPLTVFAYVLIAKIEVTTSTTFFLCIISVIISIITALLVASSIVSPLQITQSSLQSFSVKKSSAPITDRGSDEVSDIITDINRLYEQWNKEVIGQAKRQLRLDKENEITNNKASSFEAQLAQTRSLLTIAQKLNVTFDFQTNLKTILDEAIQTLNIQWASILLLDREHNEMKVACVRGIERSLLEDLTEENYPSIRLKPHEGLAGLVIKDGLPLIANKGFKDPRFKQFKEFTNKDQKVASLLCSPILDSNNNVLGVINLINRQIPPVFRNEDIPYAKDLCLLASLVIERSRMYKELFTDKLTNLLAYNVWNGYLDEEISRSHRYCQNCSVVVFDIDNFKSLVETSNNEFLTFVIGKCGNLLADLLRECDKGSSSQERFFCLLPNTDAAGAVFFAGRVKESLESKYFTFNNNMVKITFSAGIATYPENISSDGILKSAVQAVIEAHKQGGNRAVIYKDNIE